MFGGLRHVPRPFIVFALLGIAFAPMSAQDPVRPWLGWRTLETPGYRFYYLPEFEQWTREVAGRVESIDSTISTLVGYSSPKPVHVVVDDPIAAANGYALPFIDNPVTVWWATPPDPRNDIGNYLTWGEMLATHELTHIAHLTRPSRNPFQRALWSALPVNLGPIARNAPRWVYEGYATLIEGRMTGTGRPRNAWRPAILRQWAIEGRLPTYGQLNSWSDFNGGEFAYLGGSAFLEWLTRRSGDSSLVHVWRRMSARRARDFDQAFEGVYGDTPAALYGRHAAELTYDAMTARDALLRAGLVDGELVQRLTWGTGDPAVSPNGRRVAITLRERERPARVVVWSSAPEVENVAVARLRVDAQSRDPEDVPDRRFYPVRKTPERTLLASNGRSYQMPRWFADNRRVLLTRWMTRGDGTSSPGLYIWDTQTGRVRRVTPAVGVLHGDPHPSRDEAIAMQCRWGHCDIARVDLTRGAVTTVLEGNARTSYYRPRFSPDGSRFLAAVSEAGRWDVVVSDSLGKVMSRIGPNDGANRYDAQWMGRDSVVVVSERGGIANLEVISLTNGDARTLTRVTGAAVGPDVNRADGAVWFLSMHSRGFDVRRLPRDARRADSVVAISGDRFGFAGLAPPQPKAFSERPVSRSRSYGLGPRHQRWIPGGYASADGGGGFVSVYSGDIVGRLTASATGAFGNLGTWRGGALRTVWRFPRPAVELGGFGFDQQPSRGPDPQVGSDSLDAALYQGWLALVAEQRGDGWLVRGRAGGASGTLSPNLGDSRSRGIWFAELDVRALQMRGAQGLTERLRVHATQGNTGGSFTRGLAALEIASAGRDVLPVQLFVSAGLLTGSPLAFEHFVVGGAAPPLADSALVSQRYFMPMFPTGVAQNKALLAWRAALPAYPWTAFFEGAAVGPNLNDLGGWNRAVGVDSRFVLPLTPVAFAPRIEIRGGAAYTLDAPFRKRVRGFFEMKVEP